MMRGCSTLNEESQLYARTYEVSLDQGSFGKFEELVVSIYEGEEIKVNDIKGENVVLGLFGPGNYLVKASAKYENVTIEDEKEVESMDFKTIEKLVSLELKGERGSIASSVPDTTFFVNGKDIGSNSIANEEIVIQPITKGLKLQGKIDIPWGELVRNEIFSVYFI